MPIHIECRLWQIQLVCFRFFFIPKEHVPGIAADPADQSTIRFERQTPNNSAFDVFGFMRSNLLSGFPVEN